MNEPNLRLFSETFDLLSTRPFENLVRRGAYGFYLFPKNGRYQDLGSKILVPRSWYQDLWGNRSQGDGGTALSHHPNRYPFATVRTPQASLVGEKMAQHPTRLPCLANYQP